MPEGRRPSRWMLWVAIVVALIAIGIAIWLIVTRKNGKKKDKEAARIAFPVSKDDWIQEGEVLYDSSVSGPDLVLSATTAADTAVIENRTFDSSSCAVQHGLVGNIGQRRLLRFTTRIVNIGNADALIGVPDGTNTLFTESTCYNQFHLSNFVQYQLLDKCDDSTVVATGSPFNLGCITDSVRMFQNINTIETRTAGLYTCANQGISVGWAADVPADTEGNWIDITGIPSGEYTLRITVNIPVQITELDITNNTADVRVFI